MTRIVGVDPGLHGAIAVIDTDDWTLALTDMPTESGKAGRNSVSPIGVSKIMDAAAADYSFVEDVWSSPTMGVAGAFSFGRSLGVILGAATRDSVLTMVTPVEWKRRTNTPKDKSQARTRAMQLFPSASTSFARVKDDGRAEAALLAFFGLMWLSITPPKPLRYVEFPKHIERTP